MTTLLQTRLNSVVDTSYHLTEVHCLYKSMFRELFGEMYNNFNQIMTNVVFSIQTWGHLNMSYSLI
jgi:hypothetical protein